MSRRSIVANLHSGMVRLTKKLSMVDRESEISPARLSVLAVLRFGGPKTVGEISRIEGIKPPTASNLIKGLEEDNFIERAKVDTDGRQSKIFITKNGVTLIEKARQRRLDLLESLLKDLSPRDIEMLDEASNILLNLSSKADF